MADQTAVNVIRSLLAVLDAPTTRFEGLALRELSQVNTIISAAARYVNDAAKETQAPTPAAEESVGE